MVVFGWYTLALLILLTIVVALLYGGLRLAGRSKAAEVALHVLAVVAILLALVGIVFVIGLGQLASQTP